MRSMIEAVLLFIGSTTCCTYWRGAQVCQGWWWQRDNGIYFWKGWLIHFHCWNLFHVFHWEFEVVGIDQCDWNQVGMKDSIWNVRNLSYFCKYLFLFCTQELLFHCNRKTKEKNIYCCRMRQAYKVQLQGLWISVHITERQWLFKQQWQINKFVA